MGDKRRKFNNDKERDDYIIRKLIRENPHWTLDQILDRKDLIVEAHDSIKRILTRRV